MSPALVGGFLSTVPPGKFWFPLLEDATRKPQCLLHHSVGTLDFCRALCFSDLCYSKCSPQAPSLSPGSGVEMQTSNCLRDSIDSLLLGILRNTFGKGWKRGGHCYMFFSGREDEHRRPGLGPWRRIRKQRRNGEKSGTAAQQWQPERRVSHHVQSHQARLSHSAGGP